MTAQLSSSPLHHNKKQTTSRCYNLIFPKVYIWSYYLSKKNKKALRLNHQIRKQSKTFSCNKSSDSHKFLQSLLLLAPNTKLYNF